MGDQRAKFLIKFPHGYTAANLEKNLKDLGCKVEIQAVFLHIMGFSVPKSFKFKGEK